MQLKDIISDISVVINQLSDAKREIQRATYAGWDQDYSLSKQVELLQNELSDAESNIDSMKDNLYELLEALETEVYNQSMMSLSPFKGE